MLRLCRVATELDNGQTDYWLDVIHSAGYFNDEEYTSLDADNKEFLRMLASIVKTSKQGSD